MSIYRLTHVRDRFASRLNRVLAFQQRKQVQVASVLNVSRAAVSAWCAGDALPTPDNLEKLAEWLGVTTEYLLGLDRADTELRQDSRAADYLTVYHELMELEAIDPDERRRRLEDIAEFIRYVKNRRKPSEPPDAETDGL